MGSRSLFADVKARQDGLAIRGETWSSIVYLRNADFNVYRRELSDLLGSSEIRAHIKILLIEFLGTVSEPTAEEAACVRPLLENPDLRPHIMRAIAKKSDWFRLMRSAVARSCDFGPQAAYQAAWVLAPAFAFDRSFVMECLKEWSENQEFDHAIYHALSELSEWDDDAFSVLQRIITRTDFAEVWISKIAQDISRSRADLACRAVRIKLDRALSKALEECTPESPPPQDAPIDQQIAHLLLDKGRDPLRRLLRHHGEWFGLDDVAKNGPGFFVETIWTWVEATASQLCRRSASGAAHRYRDDYEWHFGENISSYLASAMWSAVSSYATAEPERFLMWASKAAESEMLSVHRLIVHGLREIATLVPRFVVDYLVSDGRRFAIGNYGGRSSNHQTLALLQAVSPILTDQELGRLLKFIECWRYCDPSKAEDAQRWNEEARLTLYSALPIDRLPLEIREKLSTQPRARESFPEEMDSERKGGMVTSPVKVEEMQNMSDAELLKTLEEYRDDRQRNTDFRLGGSTEVALQFAEFAAENPDRAISVIRQLQPDKSQLLASRGFGAISRCDKITADDVVRLARELIRAGFSSRDFRYELSWGLVSAVQRGDGLPDDLICYLRGILCEPEPTNDGDESTVIERSQKKEERKSILWDQHAKAFPGGNFPALFAITLGLLRRKPADYDQWLNVLENHLRTPENPAVWIGLIEYFRFLVNGSRERSTAFIQALVSRFPEAVSTHEGVRFMAYCREWLPQSVFDDLLRQIKSSDWRLAEQAVGEILVLRSGSVPEDEASNSRLEVLLAAPFITDTHLGMIYSAAATWTTPGIRELSHRVLMAAIPSADSETAEALMEVFMLRGPRRLPTDALTAQLLGAIATVPKLMLTIKTNDLVDRLKELLQDGYSPVEIGNLTRGIVDAAGDSIASMATALSVSAADLIDIAITIQKFPDAKPNGTWVFERLLILNAYPIAKTLIGLDRRF